jgi:hypothetical protein
MERPSTTAHVSGDVAAADVEVAARQAAIVTHAIATVLAAARARRYRTRTRTLEAVIGTAYCVIAGRTS